MPSLMMMPIMADLVFVGQMKKLPVDWQQPSGDPQGPQYPDAFKPSERMAVPEPLCYFWAASTNKYHVDTAKDIGGKFKDFCHKALDEIKKAVDMWRLEAKFDGLKVISVCALGPPGVLKGPALKDKFMGWVGSEDNEKAYIKAVKEGMSKNWKEWQDKVMVPGLPFYPPFAAFPGPSAPPMPNVPFPLITCPSPMMMKITPPELKKSMCDALDGGVKDEDSDKQHEALFMAIGTAVAMAFIMWLPMQLITNCMGKGPIPSFAPPYVPVGPVLGGDNIATPGHLSA